MVQKNQKHMARPAHKPAMPQKKQECCKCDSSCKCGCQEGKECTCCSCGSAGTCVSGLAGSILVLIGTLLVAGSILVLADKVETITGRAPKAAPAKVSAKMDDKAFAELVKKNPQVIIDSVNAFYQKQQAEKAKAQPKVADKAMIKEIVEDKGNHVLGNPKGSFVIIEFFDYNCGYCKMMNKKLADAVKKSDNIRWVLIDTPIFGEKSEIIAQYAWAAGKQGKFAEFHAALADAKDKTEAGLKEIGKKLGLNVEKLAKDATSEAAKKKLTANRAYTQKLQMGGVPMFIINGDIQGGAFSDEKMEEYIKKANDMKKAKK